jgi:O-acetyl-ADP-ribose deacetylase (regulator of RNase III)
VAIRVEIVEGDLLEIDADAIVNPWNRNTIPWWLLLPQGVSGAIKLRSGIGPFKELSRHGRLALGQAVATSAGKLSFRGIIHVAGINDFWRASEKSIRLSVRNALSVATERGWNRLAMPLIGAGSGGFAAAEAERLIVDELSRIDSTVSVTVVRYGR